jgi:hypothetical protein
MKRNLFPEKGVVEFAPDGIHWQIIKKGSLGNMWDYFNFDVGIRQHIALNPQAKFRLKNPETGNIIGVLPRKKLKKVI